ncbi:MAG: GAF domain-containing sensor histidine kinase [Nitrospirota bacterium]
MDIHIAIKKTMVYSLSVGLLTGLFVTLVLLLSKMLTDIAGTSSLSVYIFSALIIALLFNPLKVKIQSFIDTLFSKASYNYYAVIQKVGYDLSSKIQPRDIQQIVTDIIVSTLKLRDAYFFSAGKKSYFAVYYSKLKGPPASDGKVSRHKIRANAELVGLLKESRDVAVIEELPTLVGQPRASGIAREVAPFHGEVAVPVFIDGDMNAIIVLGGKVSGHPFTDDDVNLLRAIANNASLSLKSALLYAEKLRSEKLATLGSTAATLAHEIKNPLSSIKTFTQLLPEKYDDKEFRDTFSAIVPSEIERINRLVTELLTFAKEAPSGSPIGNIDLSDLLEECLKQFSEQFHKDGITVVREFKKPCSIKGDHDRLKQAFLNILSNSCQAMTSGGVLKVSTGHTNNKVVVRIEDTGVGIDENDIEKIFDPFYTTKDMGNGLGLTISKKIIDEHEGIINVKSRPREGTSFALSFDPAEDTADDRVPAEQPKLWN